MTSRPPKPASTSKTPMPERAFSPSTDRFRVYVHGPVEDIAEAVAVYPDGTERPCEIVPVPSERDAPTVLVNFEHSDEWTDLGRDADG
jgi:hypothetical protein